MPRKAKKIVTQKARRNMSIGQKNRQAREREMDEARRADKQNAKWAAGNYAEKTFEEMSDHTKTYLNDMGIISLSAAATPVDNPNLTRRLAGSAKIAELEKIIEEIRTAISVFEKYGL